jgi:beta-lactamase regulating signal transducer with metallopeptidase domain
MALLLGLYKFIFAFVHSTAANRSRVAFFLAFGGTIGFLMSVVLFLLKPQLPDQILWTITPAYRNITLSMLGLAYVFFFCFMGLKMILKWRGLRKLNATMQVKAPYEWRLFIQKHAQWMGINRKIRLVLTGGNSPATFGWLKPVIFLPLSCITQLPVSEVEALLLHEIAHISRKDFLKEYIFQVLETIMWFNPFLRQLLQEARKEREKACDALVLQFGYPAASYSNALLSVAKNQNQTVWFLNATGKGHHHLFERIHWMLTGQRNRWQLLRQSMLFLGSGALLFAMAMLTGKEKTGFRKILHAPGFEAVVLKPSENLLPWKAQVTETRSALLMGQVNRPVEKEETSQPKAQISEVERRVDAVVMAKENEIKALTVKETILPVQTVGMQWKDAFEQMAHAAAVTAIEKRMDQLPALISMLDEKRTLSGDAWEELVTLIAYYSELKNAEIEQRAATQENRITEAVEKTQNKPNEILVIAFDPETGQLASTMMPKDALPEGIRLNEKTVEDRQQVILLRKRVSGKKRIISL